MESPWQEANALSEIDWVVIWRTEISTMTRGVLIFHCVLVQFFGAYDVGILCLVMLYIQLIGPLGCRELSEFLYFGFNQPLCILFILIIEFLVSSTA